MSDVSIPVPATTPADTQTPPAAPAPPAGKVDRLQKAANVLADLAAKREPAKPQEATQAPPAAETKPAIEAPKEPAPAEKPTRDNRDLMVAKAQEASLRKDREVIEARQRAEKLEAELKARDERLKAYEADLGGKDAKALAEVARALEAKDAKKASQILRSHGLTMEDLAKAYLDEPETPEDPKEALLKQMQAEMERFKAEKAAELEAARAEREKIEQERAAEVARAESEKHFSDNVARVTSILEEQAESYPALAKFSRAAPEVVRRWNAHIEEHGEQPDLGELLTTFNGQVFEDVTAILASDHAFKAFLTRDDVKTRALSLLGVKQDSATSPASTEGDNGQRKGAPAAIPSIAAAAAGSRKSRPRSQDEKLADATAWLSARNK